MFNKINIHLYYILLEFQGFFIACRKGDILPLLRYNKWDNVYQNVHTCTNRSHVPNVYLFKFTSLYVIVTGPHIES